MYQFHVIQNRSLETETQTEYISIFCIQYEKVAHETHTHRREV